MIPNERHAARPVGVGARRVPRPAERRPLDLPNYGKRIRGGRASDPRTLGRSGRGRTIEQKPLRNKAFPDLFPHKRAAVSLLRPVFYCRFFPTARPFRYGSPIIWNNRELRKSANRYAPASLRIRERSGSRGTSRSKGYRTPARNRATTRSYTVAKRRNPAE